MKKSDGFFRCSPSLTAGQGGGTVCRRQMVGGQLFAPNPCNRTQLLTLFDAGQGGGTACGGWSVKKR